nr:Toll/interleukin-1 receptor (TIR) domain-containing protein [Tanacetum cinerariifolium]
MLKKVSNEGIVVGHNNFYDQFFVPKIEENIKIIAARLPYLDDATMVKGAVFTTITSSLSSEYSFKRGKRLESDDVDSKQENEKDVNEDESHLLNLPLYVLSMVIEFSVGVEYLKFHSTCKRCHLAALLISWNNKKAFKGLQEYSSLSPWGDVSTVTFDNLKLYT